MVFFGTDEIGNVIMLCVNQMYSIKQSTSLIYIKKRTGLELNNKGILTFQKFVCRYGVYILNIMGK